MHLSTAFWVHIQEVWVKRMPKFLGIDTSNYTTSVALLDSDKGEFIQEKMLLPVKSGELGIRQSDAVFHHTKQLPIILAKLFCGNCDAIKAVGVSTRPRNIEKSYMPCFLVGESFADSLSAVNRLAVYKTSHQIGHILSAAYSCKRLDLIAERKPFIAFHISGGTTDCLYVTPDDDNVVNIVTICSSSDLKAGQAVDRVGLMLGLEFPCGKALEQLALNSDATYKCRPSVVNGNCSLSGLENRCQKMITDGAKECDVALYCLKFIEATVIKMSECAIVQYGNLPIIYAGGVMSNKIIRRAIQNKFDAYFAEPEFSCDNACGTALYSAIKDGYLL